MRPIAAIALVVLLIVLIYSQREMFVKHIAREVRDEMATEEPSVVVATAQGTVQVMSECPEREPKLSAACDEPSSDSSAPSARPHGDLESLMSALGGNSPPALPENVQSLTENEWVSLLLSVAVVGSGYRDAQMVAFLLSVSEQAMRNSPLARAEQAVARFQSLVGRTRYSARICHDHMDKLELTSREDFYRALSLAHSAGPGILLEYGLGVPFEEAVSFTGETLSRMPHWVDRLQREGLLSKARDSQYRRLYETHAGVLPASPARPVAERSRPVTRREMIDLALSVAVCSYDIHDPDVLALLLAIIQVESDFSLSANRLASARGLGSLLDSAAEIVVPWAAASTTYTNDPFVNVHLFTSYMKYLAQFATARKDRLAIHTVDDYLSAILIGYHSGPGNLIKHGLDTPFVKTRAHMDEVSQVFPVWRSRVVEGDLLKEEAVFATIYERYRPDSIRPLEGSHD